MYLNKIQLPAFLFVIIVIVKFKLTD